jgi:hypothetical protein
MEAVGSSETSIPPTFHGVKPKKNIKHINANPIEVFWVVTQCNFVGGYQRFRRPLHPEDGGSLDPLNVGILPQHYTASQHRGTRLNIHRRESIESRIEILI